MDPVSLLQKRMFWSLPGALDLKDMNILGDLSPVPLLLRGLTGTPEDTLNNFMGYQLERNPSAHSIPHHSQASTDHPSGLHAALVLGEALEEQELQIQGSFPPSAKSSSSSLSEAVIPPLTSYADDFRAFQDLMKCLAESLQMLLEECPGVLTFPGRHFKYHPWGQITLPINEALLLPAHSLWQTPAAILPTYKQADDKI